MIEIIVKDASGGKIETHRCAVRDKKKYASILKYLKDKYGFEPEIKANKSINADAEEIGY